MYLPLWIKLRKNKKLSCVGGRTVVVVEGVEGTGVAGTLEVMEGVEVLGVLLDGNIWLATQTSVIMIDVVENIVVPVEIMMVLSAAPLQPTYM